MADMGGNGHFVIDGFHNKLYDKNTFSHLPLPIQEEKPNMLYHPIKEKYMPTSYKLKKYCVISAVGSKSLHKKWLQGKESTLFDLHLIVYDQSFNTFYEDAVFISYHKGNKLNLVFDYLQHHPEYLEHYDYFFLPDDNTQTDAYHITRMFELMEKYHLDITQQALINSHFSHSHPLYEESYFIKSTNSAKIMTYFFSRNALKKALSTLELAMDTPFSLCVTGSNTEALLEQDSAIPSYNDTFRHNTILLNKSQYSIWIHLKKSTKKTLTRKA